MIHQGTKDAQRGPLDRVDPLSEGRRPRLARVSLVVLCVLGALVVKEVAFAQAAREVMATKSGWRPPILNVKKGEVVRLQLKTEGEERCFAIDELRIEKRIVPGRATPLEFTPDRAGSFVYYDCLEPEARRGRLLVAE